MESTPNKLVNATLTKTNVITITINHVMNILIKLPQSIVDLPGSL